MAHVELGTPIVNYNMWTRFDTKAFAGQFVPFDAEGVKALKVGDIVYLDVDPLHPKGKVYGSVKVAITAITEVNGGERVIYYRGGIYSGFVRTANGLCGRITRAVDEDELARIVASLPLSTKVHVYDE